MFNGNCGYVDRRLFLVAVYAFISYPIALWMRMLIVWMQSHDCCNPFWAWDFIYFGNGSKWREKMMEGFFLFFCRYIPRVSMLNLLRSYCWIWRGDLEVNCYWKIVVLFILLLWYKWYMARYLLSILVICMSGIEISWAIFTLVFRFSSLSGSSWYSLDSWLT